MIRPLSVLLSALFVPSAVYSTPAQQPNIILIYTDDQGYNDLGCYGSARIETPHIDRMAAEGVGLTSYSPSFRSSPSPGTGTGTGKKNAGNGRALSILSARDGGLTGIIKPRPRTPR